MTPRPRAISVLGWLFIVVGSAGILKDVLPLMTANSAQQVLKLKSEWPADLAPAWASRLLAVIGGVGILYGFTWARWLLVGWMGFHIVLSIMHSPMQLLIHCLFFAPILYFLFRPTSSMYLRGER
jgi:hypothetical protein